MIRFYTKLFKMKRTTRVAAQNKQTRIKKTKQENSIQDINDPKIKIEEKVDLSKFKLPVKQKLAVEVSSRIKPVKREHIQAEYEEVLYKIKNESPNSDDANNSDENINKCKANPGTSELVEQSLQKSMPVNWEDVLKNIREMRKNLDAPVDSMGCDQCPDENATSEDRRFQALLSLMLSSQTKDQVTHAAMLKLRDHGCSLTNILGTSDEKLGELIYPVSFWKTKVKNIKRTSEMIRDTFNSDIPKTVEDLCKLPGVGPKMAHLCMKTAWGQVTGIGVDVHIHRITNRLGWVKTKTPENTRKALEGWLPRDLWTEVNHLLVGFGQQTCGAVKPKCITCLNNPICPFGKKEIKTGGKKSKK